MRWNALFVDAFLHFLGPNLKATNQQHVSEWNAEHRCGIWCRFAVFFPVENHGLFSLFLAGKPWTFCSIFSYGWSHSGRQALLFKHWRCIVFNSFPGMLRFGRFCIGKPSGHHGLMQNLKKKTGFSGSCHVWLPGWVTHQKKKMSFSPSNFRSTTLPRVGDKQLSVRSLRVQLLVEGMVRR